MCWVGVPVFTRRLQRAYFIRGRHDFTMQWSIQKNQIIHLRQECPPLQIPRTRHEQQSNQFCDSLRERTAVGYLRNPSLRSTLY